MEEYSADMGNLNTRLAAIVDRNNGIQSENQRLRDQLATVQDNHKAELDKVKSLYDNEMAAFWTWRPQERYFSLIP